MAPNTLTATAVTVSPLQQQQQQQQQSKRRRTITDKSCTKRDSSSSSSSVLLMDIDSNNNSSTATTKKSRNGGAALCFYVWTRHIHSQPHEVLLDQLTTHDLKLKLGQVLSIHPSRISEILWKKKKSDVLVLVEDTFISEHIVDGEMMTVDLEIKADGNLRLVLEF